MAYSDFTLRKVKQSFGLTAVEGGRFLQVLESIAPSRILAGLWADTVSWAIAVGTEKAKSELAKRDNIPNYFDPPCICITYQPESTVNKS